MKQEDDFEALKALCFEANAKNMFWWNFYRQTRDSRRKGINLKVSFCAFNGESSKRGLSGEAIKAGCKKLELN